MLSFLFAQYESAQRRENNYQLAIRTISVNLNAVLFGHEKRPQVATKQLSLVSRSDTGASPLLLLNWSRASQVDGTLVIETST